MKLCFKAACIYALVLCALGCPGVWAGLNFLTPQSTYVEESADHILYRNGTLVTALSSGIRLNDGAHHIEYARTVRSLPALARVEFPGLFESGKVSGKVLIAAIGGTDDSLILELRRRGVDAYGTDIFLYPNQKQSEFLFQADLRDTNLVGNQFDVVLMSWGPLTYSDSERESVMESIFSEMGRILKPSGFLYVAPLNVATLGPIVDRLGIFSYKSKNAKIDNPFDFGPAYMGFRKRTRFSLQLRSCMNLLTSGKND